MDRGIVHEGNPNFKPIACGCPPGRKECRSRPRALAKRIGSLLLRHPAVILGQVLLLSHLPNLGAALGEVSKPGIMYLPGELSTGLRP